MNTPNFTLMQLNAQERRQAILRQAAQDHLSALNRKTGPQSPLRSVGLWWRKVYGALTSAMPKSVEERTVIRSGSVS